MHEGFDCVRVDVHAQPDIASNRAARAMPDVRLCDPGGKELQQLLGFSSPERLLREGQRVLDRLAGRAVAAPAAEVGRRSVEATPAAIAGAVAAGCPFLERQAPKAAQGGSQS